MNFWSNKNVLVTGATGLVGYWLTKKLLEKRANVIALIRDFDPKTELYRSGLINQITVVSGELESYNTLERALCEYTIDTVFHLAAQTIVGTAKKAPLITFEANIRGSYNLLEACRRQQHTLERLVVASTDKAYGTSGILPYTEKMPLMGQFPYDVSKSCTDLLCQSYFHTFNLPITLTRCGNIFGGGDLNWSRLIPGTIRSFLEQKPPQVRSDGTFIRDYIYVEDVVDAYLLLAEKTPEPGICGEAFNFAPTQPYTVLKIIETLSELMQTQHLKPLICNEAYGEIKDQYLCSKKAHEKLDWAPRYSLEQGLRHTISWYQEHLALDQYALC